MDSHLVGQGQFSAEDGRENPAPTGTSMAVRQFCAAAFGWVGPHSPSQPWRVMRVISGPSYCLGCFGVRDFDLVVGLERWVAYCRYCGEEVRGG